jgi:hypothetical protein
MGIIFRPRLSPIVLQMTMSLISCFSGFYMEKVIGSYRFCFMLQRRHVTWLWSWVSWAPPERTYSARLAFRCFSHYHSHSLYVLVEMLIRESFSQSLLSLLSVFVLKTMWKWRKWRAFAEKASQDLRLLSFYACRHLYLFSFQGLIKLRSCMAQLIAFHQVLCSSNSNF